MSRNLKSEEFVSLKLYWIDFNKFLETRIVFYLLYFSIPINIEWLIHEFSFGSRKPNSYLFCIHIQCNQLHNCLKIDGLI